MAILPLLLLATLFLFDRTGAQTSSAVITDPHKHFRRQIQDMVQLADSVSPEAVPYEGEYPTINVSPWIHLTSHTNEERQDVVHQIMAQAIEGGSFNIIGHDVSVELLGRLENSTAKFFSQSLEEKRQYSSGTGRPGYIANQVEKYGGSVFNTTNPREREGDLREIFGMAYPLDFSDNVQGPEYFQSALNEFTESLQPIEVALYQIFSAALGLANGADLPLTYMHEADGGAPGYMRAHRYPAMPSEYDDAQRFLPHSDFGTLTIIYGSTKGLEEIRGGRWVEVPINKEKAELHVTVGEVLNIWSNGLFENNIHRVSNKAVKDRVSFAYFLAQAGQEPVEGIEPVCADNEVARFPRWSTATHLGRYLGAMKGQSAMLSG